MTNVTLNAGGFIGAFLGIAIGILIIYLSIGPEDLQSQTPYRFGIFALICGTLAGNFVWAKLFPKKNDSADEFPLGQGSNE
jgi:hypothetical protein